MPRGVAFRSSTTHVDVPREIPIHELIFEEGFEGRYRQTHKSIFGHYMCRAKDLQYKLVFGIFCGWKWKYAQKVQAASREYATLRITTCHVHLDPRGGIVDSWSLTSSAGKLVYFIL